MSKPLRIAVIGSGIAGLSAAWLLSKNHDVTLIEAGNYPGGHTNTIDVDMPGDTCAVDTGFIVYNPPNYPNLAALFDHLKVETIPTRMTFAVSINEGAYEYSGTRLGGIFGQWSNTANPAHWRMLRDLIRFFRSSASDAKTMSVNLTLGVYLRQAGYSDEFAQNHLLPMAAAIWSNRAGDMMEYPARAFIRFFDNHGLLNLTRRPPWRTVQGGARNYVRKIIEDGSFRIILNAPVQSITRKAGKVLVAGQNEDTRQYDHAVLACHADQSLKLLSDPDEAEQELLNAFKYATNRAIVHDDHGFMPRRKKLWSSWNSISNLNDAGNNCVTYWMNSLQSLPEDRNIFVTLNPRREIETEHIIAQFSYQHPIFNPSALNAQQRLWGLQGGRNTWFCGSYFGAGFHEDALQSGLAVAEELGGDLRPWSVEKPSGRIWRTAPATARYREAAQ